MLENGTQPVAATQLDSQAYVLPCDIVLLEFQHTPKLQA